MSKCVSIHRPRSVNKTKYRSQFEYSPSLTVCLGKWQVGLQKKKKEKKNLKGVNSFTDSIFLLPFYWNHTLFFCPRTLEQYEPNFLITFEPQRNFLSLQKIQTHAWGCICEQVWLCGTRSGHSAQPWRKLRPHRMAAITRLWTICNEHTLKAGYTTQPCHATRTAPPSHSSRHMAQPW